MGTPWAAALKSAIVTTRAVSPAMAMRSVAPPLPAASVPALNQRDALPAS
jgi:hypothetical protein